ncbi:MAG: hypothetical protein IJD43_13950 [Thermoguttaceae bacterium]|nr:hypothetical protein [Thermoguttaceae bacterium]
MDLRFHFIYRISSTFGLSLAGLLLAVSALLLGTVRPANAQLFRPIAGRENEILVNSHRCLNEIMAIPANEIPAFLFEKAEGVAIFPGLVRGGFVVGAQHGKGVLIVKNSEGQWEAPRFLKMTGGSVGFQAGVQSADVILIFCSRRSVESVIKGQFTIGADASAAAGPVGRKASASTNARLTSEIYSYSRSRGLFLGIALDGCVLDIEEDVSEKYYANGLTPEAQQLVQLTMGYVQSVKHQQNAAGTASPETAGQENVPMVPAPAQTPAQELPTDPSVPASASPSAVPGAIPGVQSAAPDAVPAAGTPTGDPREMMRRNLIESHTSLMQLLDPSWQKWLALPQEFLTQAPGTRTVPPELLTLRDRFARIAQDPKYSDLIARPEFQQTQDCLEMYLAQ